MKLSVIDDNEDLIDVLRVYFDLHKDELPPYELFSDAEEFFKKMNPDVQICVIDYYLGSITGLDLIKQVLVVNPQCWFIMFSGQNQVRVIADFMNNTYGSRYVQKGSANVLNDLLFYIKDIMTRISMVESYFYASFKNKESLAKLKNKLIDLKESL